MTGQPDPPARQPASPVGAGIRREAARYVIQATADDACAVSVDLTGDQYLAVRHVVQGVQAQPGYTPSMSIHTAEEFADTYGDSYGSVPVVYGPVVDLGPVPAQAIVPHADLDAIERRAAVVYAAVHDEDDGCPTCLLAGRDVPALVAEARRLREAHARLLATQKTPRETGEA